MGLNHLQVKKSVFLLVKPFPLDVVALAILLMGGTGSNQIKGDSSCKHVYSFSILALLPVGCTLDITSTGKHAVGPSGILAVSELSM